MESTVIIIIYNNNYSSNNEQIDIKKQIVDFFHLYFIDCDFPEKDITIRFYLSLIKTYIEYYKIFGSPLLEIWLDKIKPYILEKYPQSSTGVFAVNSDIHYLIQLIDKLKEQYGTKIDIKEKKEENKEEKVEDKNISIVEGQPNIPIIKNEEKIETKKISFSFDDQFQQRNVKRKTFGKKSRLLEEEEQKNSRMKIKSKISAFLEEFLEENKLKRANSMMSLRQSKTISSFSTCTDSICLDDTDGKYKINLNLLKVGNDEKNEAHKKAKEIIQRSKNLYEVYLDQQKDSKDSKNKQGKMPIGMQRHQTVNLFMNMTPKFNEIEEEMEGVNIEYKDKNKNLINNISIDLLLKKIIFENFLEKHTLLIYHFTQQCFCFVAKDIIFKKLFNCYKIYKNKKIPIDKLKHLIEFINILVLEMFHYYNKVNYNEMQILLIKKNYNEIISDLITNFSEKEKIAQKLEEIQITTNKFNDKKFFRFNSIDFSGDVFASNLTNNNDFKFDRNNLINANLNLDTKNINIFIFKDKEKILSDDWTYLSEKDFKEKENNIEPSDDVNIEFPKFYKISKTLKRTSGTPKKISSLNNKYLGKIDEDIKEENKEEDNLFSDNEENDNSEKKDENKEKEEQSFEELSSCSDEEEEINKIQKEIKEEEEKEEQKKSEILNNLLNKVFPNNERIISQSEDIMNQINYILPLLEIKDGENVKNPRILRIKSKIPFYKIIKEKDKITKNNEIKEISLHQTIEKLRTNTLKDNFIKLNNKITNKNYFCITDYSTEDIANKLSQVSKSLLNKICPRELYKGIYLKKDKEKTSPNIVKCINNFNKLTSFIIEDIISYSTPKLRARAYEKWVVICDYCKTNKNYNDCIAIFSALNNFIITGLNLTLKEIKSKIKKLFENISIFCTVEGNYKNIRNDMNLCEEKGEYFIPYLGMLLRDINFLEESSQYLNEKGCINMNKIEKISSLLEKYFRYKKEDKKKLDDKIINTDLSFFDNLEIEPEEELENIANNIEPEYKFNKVQIKRLTKNDIKHFQTKMLQKRSTITNNRTTLGPNSKFSKLKDNFVG